MHTDIDYIVNDPFAGDEAELTLRKVTIRTARKKHQCYGLTGNHDHFIFPGERYRHEKARIDNSFFGEFKICLSCMNKFIDGDY